MCCKSIMILELAAHSLVLVTACPGATQLVAAGPLASTCTDIQPPGDFTCSQQKSFGKCDADFLKAYCAATCNRCPATSAAFCHIFCDSSAFKQFNQCGRALEKGSNKIPSYSRWQAPTSRCLASIDKWSRMSVCSCFIPYSRSVLLPQLDGCCW